MTSQTHPGSSAASETYLPEGLPQPAPTEDGLDAPFWEALTRHELCIQHCAACGAYQWEPEWICHACQSADLEWAVVPPRGRIYSWTRAWYPVHSALLHRERPYLVVLIELPEAGDVRIAGNLLGDPFQDVASGANVEGVFEDHAQGNYTLLQWRVIPTS